MAKRIYALAKELKLDSKELVEICASAGVEGKGSALASLTDDEVEKVKAHLSGGGSSASSAPKVVESPSAPAEPPAHTAATPLRREDYIAPAGTTGKRPANLDAKPARPADEAPKKSPADASKPAAKSAPSIRLAAMPDAPQPVEPAKPQEPAPQKPDIKLPADAIRAGKAGAKPLADHIRKHEKRRTADQGAPGKAAGEATTDTPGREGRGGRRGRAAPTEREPGGLGGREQRQLKRKRVARRRGDRDDDSAPRRITRLRRNRGVNTAAPRKSSITVEVPCTVRSFSEAIGAPARVVLGKLMALGALVNINEQIDEELVELLCEELDVDVELKRAVDPEDQLLSELIDAEDPPESLEPRPPVVTFLGHVDHGKTSLLDRIIGTDVVAGESGGITQHIRAYTVEHDGRSIAFVDTPGHEAFTEMRARGANVTDIAVLVVAADDGVMPQTEEAISHARAAEVPIVVALNKIDLPGINTDKAMQDLSTNELLPSEWGGDTEVVRTSATTGEGIDDLMETLLTIAELHDFKANPSRAAVGTCLEAEVHEGRGVVAKFLVQKGSLHVGDAVVCGDSFGRVKAMHNTLRPSERLESAGPSISVDVTGLDVAPGAGETFCVVPEITQAREIAEQRSDRSRSESLMTSQPHVTLENLFDRLGETDEVQTLNLILRADVRGSIEAIKKELTKLEHPEVGIKILQATVGGITEADVYLADASDAIVIGFNVVPDEGARQLAEAKGVQVRRYSVIYQITEDLKAALEGMLRPERRDVDTGRALVLRTFAISRVGTVAGCRVLNGTVERSARIRVIRENRIIGEYPVDTLRREKDDAKEVREGFECGIKLRGFNDVKEGDVLEAYRVEEIARTI